MIKTTLMLISIGAVGTSVLGWRMHTTDHPLADQKTADLRVITGHAQTLQINVPLGHVEVIADGSKELRVHVVRSTKGKSDIQSRSWMNDSFLTAENKGDVLVVRDHPFGKDSLSGIHSDDSSDAKSGTRTLDLLVQIHAPADLAAKLQVTAGRAEISGQFRSMNAEVMAGELTADGLNCRGKSELKVGAGSIVTTLHSESNGRSKLNVGAGEVKLRVPAGVGADVSADVAVGEITGLPGKERKKEGIHLGDRRHGHSGQGDAKVDIHVGTGSIKVESREPLEASTVLDEPSEKSEDAQDFSFKGSDDFDKSIEATVSEAMKSVKISMDSMPKDMDFSFSSSHDFDDMDKDLSKSLKDIGPSIRRAMKAAKPDIEKAMREAKPEIERAMKAAQQEIKRAMKEVKPEVDKAIREAMKELEKALKELEKSEKTHGE